MRSGTRSSFSQVQCFTVEALLVLLFFPNADQDIHSFRRLANGTQSTHHNAVVGQVRRNNFGLDPLNMPPLPFCRSSPPVLIVYDCLVTTSIHPELYEDGAV